MPIEIDTTANTTLAPFAHSIESTPNVKQALQEWARKGSGFEDRSLVYGRVAHCLSLPDSQPAYLDLSGVIIDELPPGLDQLRLRVLDLSNSVIGKSPDLRGFESLRMLNLRNCRLTSVPEGLDSLPQLQILCLDDNRIAAIPAWMLGREEMTVSLLGNPLSADALGSLRKQDSGPRILYSLSTEQEESPASVQDEVDEWLHAPAHNEPKGVSYRWDLQRQWKSFGVEEGSHGFATLLRSLAARRTSAPYLVTRVCEALAWMAQSAELRSMVYRTAGTGLARASDHPMTVLESIELLIHLEKNKDNPEVLWEAGRALIRLREVNNLAAADAESRRGGVNFHEIALAYQAQLAQQLRLPGLQSADTGHLPKVSEERLDEARRMLRVLDADMESVRSILSAQDHWKQWLARDPGLDTEVDGFKLTCERGEQALVALRYTDYVSEHYDQMLADVKLERETRIATAQEQYTRAFAQGEVSYGPLTEAASTERPVPSHLTQAPKLVAHRAAVYKLRDIARRTLDLHTRGKAEAASSQARDVIEAALVKELGIEWRHRDSISQLPSWEVEKMDIATAILMDLLGGLVKERYLAPQEVFKRLIDKGDANASLLLHVASRVSQTNWLGQPPLRSSQLARAITRLLDTLLQHGLPRQAMLDALLDRRNSTQLTLLGKDKYKKYVSALERIILGGGATLSDGPLIAVHELNRANLLPDRKAISAAAHSSARGKKIGSALAQATRAHMKKKLDLERPSDELKEVVKRLEMFDFEAEQAQVEALEKAQALKETAAAKEHAARLELEDVIESIVTDYWRHQSHVVKRELAPMLPLAAVFTTYTLTMSAGVQGLGGGGGASLQSGFIRAFVDEVMSMDVTIAILNQMLKTGKRYEAREHKAFESMVSNKAMNEVHAVLKGYKNEVRSAAVTGELEANLEQIQLDNEIRNAERDAIAKEESEQMKKSRESGEREEEDTSGFDMLAGAVGAVFGSSTRSPDARVDAPMASQFSSNAQPIDFEARVARLRAGEPPTRLLFAEYGNLPKGYTSVDTPWSKWTYVADSLGERLARLRMPSSSNAPAFSSSSTNSVADIERRLAHLRSPSSHSTRTSVPEALGASVDQR